MARDAALASALAAALAEIEHRADRKTVAAHLGVDVSTLGRWVTGERSIPIDKLPKIDALCRQPRGHVLRLAGYVDDGTVDVIAAIMRDPNLDEDHRGPFVDVYRTFRTLSSPSTTA